MREISIFLLRRTLVMRDMSVFDNLTDENFEEIKKLSTLVINGESIVSTI